MHTVNILMVVMRMPLLILLNGVLFKQKRVRRRVVTASDLPRNWDDFLHVNENKTELFHFFLSQLVSATYFHGRLAVLVVKPLVLILQLIPVPMKKQIRVCCCTLLMQPVLDVAK
jgi:hypothetical protein